LTGRATGRPARGAVGRKTGRALPKRHHTRTRKTATPAPVSEHVEQREFVSAFRKRFPQVRIYAVPNGEARSRTAGARLKAEGVSPGVPDLHIPEWRMWIEMKRAKGGRVSAEQADWHAYLRSIGDTVIVARGQHDAWRQIDEILTKEIRGEA